MGCGASERLRSLGLWRIISTSMASAMNVKMVERHVSTE